MRLENICIDVLHTVDLGINPHIIANIIWVFAVLRCCFGGSTYAERVEKVNKELTSWYKSTKCKSRIQGPLTLERLRTTKLWPKLKAKGAQARHLARFALSLVVEFADVSDPYWGSSR